MKVALVTHLLGEFGGGVTKVVNDLFDRMQSKYQVKVFGLDRVGREFSLAKGFYDSKSGLDFGLEKSIVDFRPDLIHLHGMFTLVSRSAWKAARTLNVPLIVSPHGMLDPWALRNSQLKKTLFMALVEKKVLAYASQHHALNESEANSIVALTSDPAKVVCIPNGVDLPADCYSPSLPDLHKLRILFLGRLHPKKGLSELFVGLNLAFIQAPHLRRRIQLDVVGWGEDAHTDFFKQQVNSLNLNDVVKFRGPAFGHEKAMHFLSSDIFVLPSHSEGLPMAVLEAWSYGLPVMMTQQCNLDVGFRRDAAIKITTEPESIARAILDLSNYPPKELEEIGAKGRDLIGESFSWGSVISQYGMMYSKVMQQHVAL